MCENDSLLFYVPHSNITFVCAYALAETPRPPPPVPFALTPFSSLFLFIISHTNTKLKGRRGGQWEHLASLSVTTVIWRSHLQDVSPPRNVSLSSLPPSPRPSLSLSPRAYGDDVIHSPPLGHTVNVLKHTRQFQSSFLSIGVRVCVCVWFF